MTTCERCGEVNPAEIHTCTPQEPVAFMDKFGQVFNPAEGQCYIRWKMRDKLSAEEVPMPLYTAPPQRNWQGLTDEEAEILIDAHWEDLLMLIELIEAKLKQKNA